MSYDLLLKGGVIYNGAGTPGVHGDVAVQGGQIVDDHSSSRSSVAL
jgi:N-acyl-D-aspartate/D-glutamate deacylase